MTNFKLEGNTWTWKCNGEAGTTPADCSANKKPKPEAPACHSDYNGKTLENLTAGNHLCNPGTMTNFKLEGNTWTWKCNGEAGTTPADCSANKKPKPEAPACHSDYNGKTLENLTAGNHLCNPGTMTNFKLEGNTWTWKCNGEAGTTPADCSANKKPKPEAPACHSDYNGKTLENLTAGNHLCNPGTMTNFKLEGNTWTWKCNGEAGTTPADCSANKKPKPEVPACHSDYNGKTLENLTAGNHLCNPGTMTNFKLEGNTWTWKCNGEAGTTPADCSANKKEEAPIYDLALTKKLADKKSSYKPGDDIFIIFTIYNQGNREATNIQLTDYIPEGLEVTDSMWNDVGNTSIYFFTDTIAPGMSAEVYMKATIKPDFKGSKIVNKAEISKDNSGDYNTTDKDSTPNNNPNDDCYTGDDKHIITGNGKAATAGNCTDATDEDDHDGVSIAVDQPTPPVDPITYDLALTKTIINKKASYKAGDELEFTFTIYNQGNKDARNIQITDYFPSDLELLDSSWTLVGGKATKTLTDTIAPNSHKSLTMKVKIKPDFKGSKIINKAEISKDNSGDYNTTDKDSTPNNNPNDDCYSGDDKHIITGNGKAATAGNCTDATDEDDHDGVCIKVDAKPEIKKNLTGDPNYRYKIGELVGFKMPFKNTTPNTLQKVSIKDFLPLNLEYVSSEIQGVSPIMSGLSVKSGVTVLEYSGFNLAPNQEGYLLFTGRVKVDNLSERINTVGIYVNDLLVESDTESYKITHPNLMIEKLVDKKIINSGDVVTFTLNVRVLSGAYDELKVVDTLPKGLVYVENTQKLTNSTTNTTITDFSTGKNTNNLDTLNWKLAFADTIKAGQTFQLQFQAKLLETSNGKYTNTACVEDPKTPHDPICDLEDVTPRDPKGDLSIKKYVNTV
ncbi:MAG: isopeptide-forming domain-containing fimbrial protein [bacterium]|nr:isopeptide-forming domain-containing fimbrial protein [bacterium]